MIDDEIWDEDQWEAYLSKEDDRISRYMKLLYQYLSDFPMPDPSNRHANQIWQDGFRAYLTQHGMSGEHFEHHPYASGSDEQEGGEELFSEIKESDEFSDIFEESRKLEHLPVFMYANDLGQDVLTWSDGIPGEIKDSELVQFCANIMQIGANIAHGHTLGYDRDMLGGNIACLKRGISAANRALQLLQEMKSRSYMTIGAYRVIYERTYEARNQVGVYIQELREQFNLGID